MANRLVRMVVMGDYWLVHSLVALPIWLAVYGLLGVPLALLMLPRQDWQQRALVAVLGIAGGGALITVWMFLLGTVSAAYQLPLLRADFVVYGWFMLTLLVWGGAGWKMGRTAPVVRVANPPLAADERLLIGLLVIAVLIRWITTSFWNFGAYDTLWVYGYQGRLFTLLHQIPQTIGYYPPFVSLQYALPQILLNTLDDHLARAVIPCLMVGSIVAAYLLGTRLFTRRIGIVAAALWALYPQMSSWAHEGDLEIPLTFLFTLAALFFVQAWTATEAPLRRRYALLAGAMFGIAMWTKPTAGAFVWGVLLLVAVELVRVRFDLRRWLPRLEVAVLTGIACIPLGALWYGRNILLGHAPIDLPPAVWLSLARRSGDLLGWWLLALVLGWCYIWWQNRASQWITPIKWVGGAGGILLIFAGAVPSMPLLDRGRYDPPLSYIRLPEAILIVLGIGVVFWAALPLLRRLSSPMAKMGWVLLLALPYYGTWFFSYSYHYRLSFAIVPLLIVPSAWVLAQIQPKTTGRQVAMLLFISVVSLPGILASYQDASRSPNWLVSGEFPNELSRYRAHNADMVLVAEQLQAYINDYRRQPIVIAPGEQRLPFFFPLMSLTANTLPTHIAELGAATHFIYGDQAQWRYQDAQLAPADNQIVASFGREEVFERKLLYVDGVFRYEVYRYHPENRWRNPRDYVPALTDEVIFDGTVRLYGQAIINNQLNSGSKIFYEIVVQALEPPTRDYTLRFQWVNLADGKVYHTIEEAFAEGEHGAYRAKFWETGEFIATRGILITEDDANKFPPGDYALVIALVAPAAEGTLEAVPVTINGELAAEYRLTGFMAQ